MEMAGYKRYLLKTIRNRQLQFFGHVNRANETEKQILCGMICGTKGRGKERIKYTDSLNSEATRKESPNNELIRKTDNIEEWKVMIADVCNRTCT
ncbi:endonuclease-reverse transcriptase [Plakobranchus ocellatus]|uniref:Endonuclease-reverse transcriptase n=1 Tax=Plakobranchus ocellatus TaxID=259542 RepID=A0AAV3ZT44_9GAST|nr:endonuclease-reverse transcriptase [Plakobranchus ocellatus]